MARTAACFEYQFRQDQCIPGLPEAGKLSITGLLAGAYGRLRRWRALASQRQQLAQLSDEMLKDIGLSRVDALREAKRPFWDDPKCLK